MTSQIKRVAEAAVLIAVAGSGDDERILLTQRAAHLTLHSGEVAFPGGMREPQDDSLRHTAVREAHEEVGLRPELVRVIGELPSASTRGGIRVTSYVAQVPESVELVANLSELESFFWLPTAFILEDNRLRTDIFQSAVGEHWAPAYNYLGYTIWGLTARILVEFVNRFWDAGLGLEHAAPRAVYRQPVKN